MSLKGLTVASLGIALYYSLGEKCPPQAHVLEHSTGNTALRSCRIIWRWGLDGASGSTGERYAGLEDYSPAQLLATVCFPIYRDVSEQPHTCTAVSTTPSLP